MKVINPVKISSVQPGRTSISYRESTKHQYRGYQDQHPRMQYQELSKPLFNHIQQRLYEEALYGLKAYTQSELRQMPKERRNGIISRANKVQDVLNHWKQEVAYDYVDRLLTALFPKSAFVKRITSVKGTDKYIKSFQTFKELGLDQLKIAQKLHEKGLLPRNFFALEPKPL